MGIEIKEEKLGSRRLLKGILDIFSSTQWQPNLSVIFGTKYIIFVHGKSDEGKTCGSWKCSSTHGEIKINMSEWKVIHWIEDVL